MFLRDKTTTTEQSWYSPGANRSHLTTTDWRRSPSVYRARRSPLATAGSVVAGTAMSGLVLFWVAYFVAKVVLLPTFIVNVVYLISALNTPHGMDHFNPTWLIISGLVVLFG